MNHCRAISEGCGCTVVDPLGRGRGNQLRTPPVVLVIHSLGGANVSQYLQGAPDAVAGVVLVNALMVEDGEAVRVTS